MYRLAFFFIVLILTSSSAQEPEIVQQEINKTLWAPFKEAFEMLDAEALNSLYADNVLRVTPNGIDTENKFKEGNLKRFEENRAKDIRIQLDFWFDSRHTNSMTSYEVGFYRMKLLNEEGENTIFGQFHIVLQKINGSWRITQDWDTTEINGVPISKDDFDNQLPIEFK